MSDVTTGAPRCTCMLRGRVGVHAEGCPALRVSDVTTEALYIDWTPERLRDEAIRQARIANGAMQLAQDRQIEANVWRGRHAEAEAETERLRGAIEAHRERWQSVNGTNPDEARPADNELWAALDITALPPSEEA